MRRSITSATRCTFRMTKSTKGFINISPHRLFSSLFSTSPPPLPDVWPWPLRLEIPNARDRVFAAGDGVSEAKKAHASAREALRMSKSTEGLVNILPRRLLCLLCLLLFSQHHHHHHQMSGRSPSSRIAIPILSPKTGLLPLATPSPRPKRPISMPARSLPTPRRSSGGRSTATASSKRRSRR